MIRDTQRHDDLPAHRVLLLQALQRLGLPEVGESDGEGLWALVVVSEKCDACGMCAHFCPTGALQKTQGDGTRGLAFTIARCVDCHLCVDCCYRHAISHSHRIPLQALVDERPLLLAMLAPDERMPLVAAICLGIVALIYRIAPRRLLTLHRLILLLFFVLPPLFVLGEADRSLLGLRYSAAGLQVSLAIGLRMVVILSAAEGLSRTVDPAELAGVFERAGLRGLGFALGVALNMLPALQAVSRNTWQALKMRGGLGRQWSQAIRWLVASILCNALRRAEEVALAAEARAFTPESSRPMPISRGRLDWLPAVLGPMCWLLAVLPWQRIFA